ncbi:hypothetical protein CPC08DRAFT_211880 [Agrocybe pediades]|nr:hypothetical protein CPC08DRAFT_211880 [Agrocybe pediades]
MSALVQISRDPSLHRHHDPENPPLYLRLLHASLGDYLLDPVRSKQFHIDMDNEITEHVIRALQYFASCCSGLFNPKSNAAAPLHILRGSRHGYYYMGRRIGQIMMFSLELQHSVLFFPLKEFLEPHTSSRAYPQLLKEFVTPFWELLNDFGLQVRTDPTLSYIKDHHLGNLRSALLPQVQKYFYDDRQALVLVLFYHLASHRYVPILEKEYSYEWYSTPFYPIPGYNEEDVLSLSYLWRGWSIPFCVGDNVYHRFVRQLLRDAGTTGEYALGPTVHERAALACFKEFSTCTVPLLPSALGKNNIVAAVATTVASNNEEDHDDAYPKLTFNPANGGRWQLTFSGKWKVVDEELYFLLLGYLIFILPRCGRSDALIAACELEAQKMPYIDQQDVRFPVRRRLLHKEVNNYLARVSPTSCVGTKM